MSTKHEQNSRERTPVDAKALRAIVELIHEAAKGYLAVADKMDEQHIKTIEMTGIRTLETTVIQRLRGSTEAARRAFNEAVQLDFQKEIAGIKKAVKKAKPKSKEG